MMLWKKLAVGSLILLIISAIVFGVGWLLIYHPLWVGIGLVIVMVVVVSYMLGSWTLDD